MTKYQKRHRIIATFFLLIFFPTLLPDNLFASNNGPNSFEAASFEPVDATDMVNLVTGDMSYVLPLLNVPSPEGGYPLTLSNHAGIAMDQEASWVGLGWSLNPGSINRNTNGYPDDVATGSDETFIFDQGELEFYTVGLGVNINGINAGVGAYWGSNKTFGGSVSFGVGPASITTGTHGTSGNVGYSGSVEHIASNVSTGVSFKTLQNLSTSSIGTGISQNTSSFSKNDYIIGSSSNGLSVGIGGFYVYYGHTKASYNLYEQLNKKYTGILYPNKADIISHDVNKLTIYQDGTTNIIDVNDYEKNAFCDNVLLPNYDKYNVQAQGLSGTITPTFTEEIKLKHEPIRFGEKILNEYTHQSYIPEVLGFNNLNNDDESIKLNNKIFFEFENTNSSFLRIDRTNIIRDINKEATDSNQDPNIEPWRGQKYAKTNKTDFFNESLTNNNIPIKNNYRKRTGKSIEVFTNQQILDGISNNVGSFIEAKNLNRNQPQTYRPESIGAYQITDIDGKVYHYSLPVINFEIWHKNFSDPNNENSNFMERELDTPYATDWLLTAVTGPDYVDINGNNKVDKDDYGYWVEFDYGKWSDGFIWNGASGNYDVVKGDIRNKDQYEYYKGRKQIYYLDAVRTRTHTAYFIKSLRQDAQGNSFTNYTTRAINGVGFDKLNSPKTIRSKFFEYYNQDLNIYNLPKTYNGNPVGSYFGYKKSIRYSDFPVHYSLKLDKIILVKNDKLVINKSAGSSLVANKKAYLYENKAFEIQNICYTTGTPGCEYTYNLNGHYYTNSNSNLKEILIHQNENVIDVNDIAGLDINTNAEKIINFQYDANYSLMPNSFHSEAPNKGKLTLKAIDFLGKGGMSYMPKYKFNYNNPSIPFNVDNEDGWGYHKTNPDAWSLSQVITPIGSIINIQYESDDYGAVASKASRVFNKGMSYYITKNSTTNELYFEVTKNTETGDNTVDEFTTFNDYFKINESVGLDLFICRTGHYGSHNRSTKLDLNEVMGQVTAVTNYSVTIKLPNDVNKYWKFDDQDEGWILNRKFSLTSLKFSDGTNDDVWMTNAGERNCGGYTDSHDSVNFHYRLASSSIPSSGKGGGIRVKEINVSDGVSTINRLNYYYTQKLSGKSFGVTSFVPSKEFTILPYASELPPPVVMYSTVSIEETNKADEILSRTEYNFETLSNYQKTFGTVYSLGNYFTVKKSQNDISYFNWSNSTNSGTTSLTFTKHEIKSSLNNLGRLLSIKNYNSSNQLLYALENNYYIPKNTQDEFGTKQESFLSLPNKNDINNKYGYGVNSVSKIWYPNQLAKTSVTQGGITKSTTYNKYDFLTGQVLETTTTSDGQSYKIKVIPAYIKYPEMGSKVDNINNKNMLSQEAANYSYIFDKNDSAKPWKETGVGITTWSNIWEYRDIAGTSVNVPASAPSAQKIWRKHKTYIWNGIKNVNGIFTNYDIVTGSKDDNFDWTIGVGQPAQWKQISEVTLYDHFSTPLEMKDINGNFASTKMGDNNTKVMTTGNAGYSEMFYAGGENITPTTTWLEPEVSVTSASQQNGTYFHTGKKSVAATSSSQFGVAMKSGQHRVGRYKISVWVEKTNAAQARIKDNGAIAPFTESYTAGNWVLKSGYVNVISGAYSIYVTSVDGSTVYFDDLMIRPAASSITGYVYNEWDELTHIIGNNGLATRFEYDAAGRLIKTYSEVIDDVANGVTGGFKLSSVKQINYKNL